MATFRNQASLAYNGNVLNSNIVTGEILDALSANKTATPTTYRPGDTVTYVINLYNSGNTTLQDITVTDNLGAYTYGTQTPVPLDYVANTAAFYVDGAIQATPTVTSVNPLTVSNLNLPAGSRGTLVYQATVNDFAAPLAGGQINNTATVNATGITAPVTVDNTINASDAANLAITKEVSPAVVSENGTLTYTFRIQNYGSTPVTTAENAVVTDTFNPALNPINVSFNGTPWTENANYTYNPATGEFATTNNQIEVGAASYTQDPTTGQYTVSPGTATLVVSGTV